MGKSIDAVVVPVGGGGLLASTVTVFKELQPGVNTIVSRIDDHIVGLLYMICAYVG